MQLIEELKRRNVFKVAAAYAAVAWMFLELSALALNAFSAPAWVMKAVIFFAIAGFAVAVLMAWAFELTQEGIKLTTNSEEASALSVPVYRKLTTITISALAIALILVVIDAYVLTEAPMPTESVATSVQVADPQALASNASSLASTEGAAATTAEENSLAILPFENLSSDPEQEYFSDGLTEELINTLAEVDGLLVTGRTSSFYFKDSELPLQEVADMLGVANVLQGSVRKSGNELRIAVQLTAIDTGFTLWSQTFDRQLDDIFVVQEEIATAVATALSVTLGAGEFAQPGMTRNVAAYDAYMQGRTALETFTAESLLEGIVHMENALRLDPDFALAWHYLGRLQVSAFNMLPREQTAGFLTRRDESMAKAAALAPEMRSVSRVRVNELFRAKDFLGVEQVLQEEAARYGFDAETNSEFSSHLIHVGRLREALVYAQRAKRQDPYSASTAQLLAGALATNERFAEARQEIARGLTLGGNESDFYYVLSMLEMSTQDWRAAREATSHLYATRDVQTRILDDLIAGDTADSAEFLRELFANQDTVAPVVIGSGVPVYAALIGEPEFALEMLDAITLNGNTLFVLPASFFDDMRRLPGFKTLMEKEGLLNYWRTSGNWADYCRPVNDDFECF